MKHRSSVLDNFTATVGFVIVIGTKWTHSCLHIQLCHVEVKDPKRKLVKPQSQTISCFPPNVGSCLMMLCQAPSKIFVV